MLTAPHESVWYNLPITLINMARTKTTTKEVKPKKSAYTLEVSVNDTNYKGEAGSVEEALKDFITSDSFPVGAKTRVVIKVSDGKTERVKVLQTSRAQRILRLMTFKPSAVQILADKLTAELNA